MSARYVVLSGCSGGGKSTLLSALRRRGYGTVDEPGRRVVKDEIANGGQALPWIDPAAFAQLAIELAIEDFRTAESLSGWVFFDRGLVDAAVAREHTTGDRILERLGPSHRYHPTVFLAPPWTEIYVSDPERRHGFDDAVAEYGRLERAYPALGYRVVVLPKSSVEERADLILAHLPTLTA